MKTKTEKIIVKTIDVSKCKFWEDILDAIYSNLSRGIDKKNTLARIEINTDFAHLFYKTKK